MGKFGPIEVTLIVFALILLFGGRKIPELMKGIGKGIKEFKSVTKEDEKNEKDEK